MKHRILRGVGTGLGEENNGCIYHVTPLASCREGSEEGLTGLEVGKYPQDHHHCPGENEAQLSSTTVWVERRWTREKFERETQGT